jgi:NAD(P)-dependent dehydrogenase (short-subunit alcohol dehydrogenase family)
LIGLTRVLALELAPYQVNVNLVSPGAIAVGANREKNLDPEYALLVKQEVPLGRMGEGEEVANLALFLASDESNYITGADIVIDGGLLLRPFGI